MSVSATLVEKILARAAGLAEVRPGQLLTVKVDFAFAHDSSGPRRWAKLAEMGARLWDPAKIAIVSDHYAPAADAQSAAILKLTREFVREHEVGAFFDMQGISHLVLAEHGLIRPGHVIAGGDSHTPMGGAFGAYAAGYGATDMAAIVATGETWLSVPATIRVDWSGGFGPGVTAKDVMLFLARTLGMDNAFKAVEFGGDTVSAMTLSERMVLCNMGAELGAEAAVAAPDDITFAYLAATGRPVADEAAARALASDDGAAFEAHHRFAAAELAPQIAAPHSPANSAPADSFSGVEIDQAYIGACVGAKLSDLEMAARVLKGRKVAAGTRLLVAPASSATTADAVRSGVLATLLEAGATLMPTGCGACAGMGAGLLADGETCISTTNRNFQGRMGSSASYVYLGSPYSVAAAAVAGRIVDPRELLAGREAA